MLPGCKQPLLDFQNDMLSRFYMTAFGIAPLHLLNMFAAILCANHVVSRWGKGLTPRAYRLTCVRGCRSSALTIADRRTWTRGQSMWRSCGRRRGRYIDPSSAVTASRPSTRCPRRPTGTSMASACSRAAPMATSSTPDDRIRSCGSAEVHRYFGAMGCSAALCLSIAHACGSPEMGAPPQTSGDADCWWTTW